jgi:hypothetical protein
MDGMDMGPVGDLGGLAAGVAFAPGSLPGFTEPGMAPMDQHMGGMEG